MSARPSESKTNEAHSSFSALTVPRSCPKPEGTSAREGEGEEGGEVGAEGGAVAVETRCWCVSTSAPYSGWKLAQEQGKGRDGRGGTQGGEVDGKEEFRAF